VTLFKLLLYRRKSERLDTLISSCYNRLCRGITTILMSDTAVDVRARYEPRSVGLDEGVGERDHNTLGASGPVMAGQGNISPRTGCASLGVCHERYH